jgi:hypothetical protein
MRGAKNENKPTPINTIAAILLPLSIKPISHLVAREGW